MTKSKSTLGLTLLALLCLAFGVELKRPIWIDETAEFAMGAFESSGEAWRAFLLTVDNMNHGQTGAYYMLGHWLMKWFGASIAVLRVPALLTAGFLYYAVHQFFEQLKVPARWQAFAFLALFSHQWIEGFFWEARNYIMLAAGTAATAAYYFAPVENRTTFRMRFVGWTGVLLGALFHPYFSLYWFLTALAGYAFHCYRRGRWMNVWEHCNLWLCAVGVVAYFGIAYPTWLLQRPRDMAGVGYRPFEFLPSQWSFPRWFYANHFLFLRYFKIPMTALFAVAGMLVVFHDRFKRFRGALIGAYGIFFVALFVSAVTSFLSYRASYWILERQWIASMVLCVMGTTWFMHSVSDALPRQLSRAWTIGAIVLVTISAGLYGKHQVEKNIHWLNRPEPYANLSKEATIEQVKNWEFLARANIAQGGPVWPEFKKMFGVEP